MRRSDRFKIVSPARSEHSLEDETHGAPLLHRRDRSLRGYCPDTDRIYAVPVADAANTLGTLRVDPPRNGQAKGVRWAVDYELPA